MAASLLALVILAAPYWFEDSDRARTPAPAASPASPSCNADDGLWGSQCVARNAFLAAPAGCADGVVLFTDEMKAPECVTCDSDRVTQSAPVAWCAHEHPKKKDTPKAIEPSKKKTKKT